jgi:hypothetical protein
MVLLRKNPGTVEVMPFWVLGAAVSVSADVGKASAAFSKEFCCGATIVPFWASRSQRDTNSEDGNFGNLMVGNFGNLMVGNFGNLMVGKVSANNAPG